MIQWSRTVAAFLIFVLISPTCAVDIKWTPAESAGDEFTAEERQLLSALEQEILRAPNPEARLREIAEKNDMSPTDLATILQRNHQAMQQSRPQGVNSPVRWVVGTLLQGLASIALWIWQLVQRHPRRSSGIGCAVSLLSWLSLYHAPRTGVVIPTGNSLRTTTAWMPPTAFLRDRMDAVDFSVIPPPSLDNNNIWESIETSLDGDEELLESVDFDQSSAVVARRIIDVEDIAETEEWLISQVALGWERGGHGIFEWTNMLPSKSNVLMRLLSSVDASNQPPENIAMVVRGLGVMGRYALVPFLVEMEEVGDGELEFQLSTSGHFDGQINVHLSSPLSGLSAEEEDDEESTDDEEQEREDDTEEDLEIGFPRIQLRVALVTAEDSKMNKFLATKFVEELTDVLEQNLLLLWRQNWTRQRQSKNFRQGAQQRARNKRKMRSLLATKLEEMASDRRRRNRFSTGGQNYRPSGDRMKSPNNAVFR